MCWCGAGWRGVVLLSFLPPVSTQHKCRCGGAADKRCEWGSVPCERDASSTVPLRTSYTSSRFISFSALVPVSLLQWLDCEQ
jgi:hypothetical protein